MAFTNSRAWQARWVMNGRHEHQHQQHQTLYCLIKHWILATLIDYYERRLWGSLLEIGTDNRPHEHTALHVRPQLKIGCHREPLPAAALKLSQRSFSC